MTILQSLNADDTESNYGVYLMYFSTYSAGPVLELIGRHPARHNVVRIHLPQRNAQSCTYVYNPGSSSNPAGHRAPKRGSLTTSMTT